jgi:hypothetical protein
MNGPRMAARYRLRISRYTLVVVFLLAAACDVFQGGRHRPRTPLTEREFIEAYVALANARSVEEKRRILEQRGTSEKELQAFIQAYADDLPALSMVFDSVVARLGMQPGMEVPALPY